MADQSETLTEAVENADAPYGQVMFIVFGTAVVLVSLAVALLSVSTTWWMLGIVFAIHLTATVIVCIVIARALTGRSGRAPGRTGRASRTPAGWPTHPPAAAR